MEVRVAGSGEEERDERFDCEVAEEAESCEGEPLAYGGEVSDAEKTAETGDGSR